MPAPKGNKFWQRRAKHGREKLFKTPDLLWQAACEYFQWCDDNPLIAVEVYGKDAVECHLPKVRAYTLTGLCIYLDCNRGYFSDFKESIKGKKDKKSKDFSSIITRIEEIIYTQKFEAAAAGFLNANIISRDLGLADKQEIDNNTTINVEID